MFLKKFRVLTLSVLVAVALLAAVGGTASAVTYTDNGVDLNGQGVFVPTGFNQENFDVSLVNSSAYSSNALKFYGPLVDIAYDAQGNDLNIPPAMTYVYFNLSSALRAGWDQGRVDIYYRDVNSGSWTRCATTFLVNGANGTDGRIACVVPQFTVFGVALRPTPQMLDSTGTLSNPNLVVTDNIARTGNQGVYVPAGVNLKFISVRIVDSSVAPWTPFIVNRPVILLSWAGNNIQDVPTQGEDQTQTSTSTSPPANPLTLTYVFYNLDRMSQLAWEEDSLSIYYYNVENNNWTACPTFLVGDEGNGMGRVACVAPQFTFYALGISD